MRSTCGGIVRRSRRVHGRPANVRTIARSRRSSGSMRRVCRHAAEAGHLSHAVHTALRAAVRARGPVALQRRVVMDGQARRIHEPVPRAIQVEREQRFLAAEEVVRMVAAGAYERVAPEGGRAGQQPEDRPARQRDGRVERAVGHQPAGRVLAFVGADQHARGDGRDVRIRVEQVRGFGDRAGRPPRVVVAERNVARAGDGDAEIAAGRAEVARRMHQRDMRKAVVDQRGRVGVRRVVDDDRRPVGQHGQVFERAREFGGAPAGQHDRGHARLARRQRDTRGRYADVTSHSSRQIVSGSRRAARI